MNNKLNVRKAIELYRGMTEEYGALVGIAPGYGVHIQEKAMTQVAPLSVWNLNTPAALSDNTTVYVHQIQVDGVKFFVQTHTPIEVPDDPAAQP